MILSWCENSGTLWRRFRPRTHDGGSSTLGRTRPPRRAFPRPVPSGSVSAHVEQLPVVRLPGGAAVCRREIARSRCGPQLVSRAGILAETERTTHTPIHLAARPAPATASPGHRTDGRSPRTKDTVETVAQLPDGTRLVSGLVDRTVRVWHASKGEGHEVDQDCFQGPHGRLPVYRCSADASIDRRARHARYGDQGDGPRLIAFLVPQRIGPHRRMSGRPYLAEHNGPPVFIHPRRQAAMVMGTTRAANVKPSCHKPHASSIPYNRRPACPMRWLLHSNGWRSNYLRLYTIGNRSRVGIAEFGLAV